MKARINPTELPQYPNPNRVFFDFETSSGNPELKSVNPWKHCSICGLGVTVDDDPNVYYFDRPNETVIRWFGDLLRRANSVVAHNIKYDAHVLANNTDLDLYELGVVFEDTLTFAKLVDSYSFRHRLKDVTKRFLGLDIDQYENELKPYIPTRGKDKNHDYGRIPVEVIGPYCCMDVDATRKVYGFCCEHLREETWPVWETEKALTRYLYKAERDGIPIHEDLATFISIEAYKNAEKLRAEIQQMVGWDTFRPDNARDCEAYFIRKLGLPIIETHWKTGKVSLDKHVLEAYMHYHGGDKTLIEKILRFRELSKIEGTYTTPYILEHSIDGIIHCDYVQTVKTGRMSCTSPNMQNLPKMLRQVMIPPEGREFISSDYSQIELRLIVHYIKDMAAIRAYREDPDTDFHQYVADMCGVDRAFAKSLNFGMNYGMGKKKFIDSMRLRTGGKTSALQANEMYDTFHRKFPKLRRTFGRCMKLCNQRARENGGLGYVYNLYGRFREIDAERSKNAFNSVIQSCAADLMKERVVALMRLIEEKQYPITLHNIVHDEILLSAPTDLDSTTKDNIKNDILTTLESPSVELQVPIRCSWGTSTENWQKASE